MHIVLDHPLVAHRVTLMRDKATPHKLFRELVDEITTFLAYEALHDIRTSPVDVETPVAKTTGRRVDEPNIIIVPILRAGMGMVGSMLDVLPYAKVGVLGMQRNEETAEPVTYYSKVPPAKSGDELALVVDPMLATGGSACDAVAELKRLGAKYGVGAAQIPVAWAISKGTLPIIGVTKVSHVEDAVKAANVTLTAEETKDLEELADSLEINAIRF